MSQVLAAAYPRKQFFLEMFTRDISLEDCILDLIDNSIDGLIRTRDFDILSELFNPKASASVKGGNRSLPKIDVTYSERQFTIKDNCGGIPFELARREVFCFGHSPGETLGKLGVYGVGLKRAIFKIGNHFHLDSQTEKDGFKVTLPVQEWAKKDKSIEDWTIPLEKSTKATSPAKAGTSITIKDLRAEVKMRVADGQLERTLTVKIAQAYALFLDRYVKITLNGKAIEPIQVPIAASEEVQPGHREYMDGRVRVRLFGGLAERDSQGNWMAERAGWYVFCNGRAVLSHDKTDLTGWGAGVANYHSKYRGFVGLAFFQSENPLDLPWTTTKRGINRESPVYQRARKEMSLLMRPVFRFLDDMYKSEVPEEPEERRIAEEVKRVDVRNLPAARQAAFTVSPRQQIAKKTSVSVQFNAEVRDIQRAAKCLRQPGLPASRVVENIFRRFLDTECPE
jgi:hypothetical protein